MENQEIKEANRKAMPMFILLVIAGRQTYFHVFLLGQCIQKV